MNNPNLEIKLFTDLKNKFEAWPAEKRAWTIVAVTLGLFFILNLLLVSPIQQNAAELNRAIQALSDDIQGDRERAEVILTEVKNSVVNPASQKSRSYQEQLDDLDTKLSVYYDQAVPINEMIDVARQLVTTSSDLRLVSLESLGTVELLNEHPEFAQLASLENRAKLFKRGARLVIEGDFFAIYDYLSKLEHYKKKIFWDDFNYTVTKYPLAQVMFSIYTLTPEEGWAGG